jgi:heme O synthase-like polyprenyltransferase
MTPWMTFISENAGWLAGLSLFTFIITLVLVPVLVVRIPADYFSHHHRHRMSATARHPLVSFLISSVKNIFGIVLALAGVLMLFTPGQGLITLLVGLMIMNYPGKYTLERWLIRRLHILPAMNWFRTRRGRPPLQMPTEPES